MSVTLIIIFAILLVCLFIGTPVSSALGFTACVAMILFMQDGLANHLLQVGRTSYTQGVSINQMVAPLFILMAEFLARGGIAEDIYEMLSRVMKNFKGGLAIATTLACTMFAALCGSSPATAASVGRISIQSMIKRRYEKGFAVGTVAAGGTLGIMIPPSISLVYYGIITETSIAKLLMAGLLPGLMLSALLCISIIIRVRVNPKLIDTPEELNPFYNKEKQENQLQVGAEMAIQEDESKYSLAKTLGVAVPAICIILIVIGTMYTGFATPTESAGFGAIASFIVVVVQRRINRRMFGEVLKSTARTTCMIIFLVLMGLTLSYAISFLGIAQGISAAIVGSGTNPWAVMIGIFVLWFILGCLMDPGSMVILTIPFIGTTLFNLGFDPIWVGIVSTLCVEIGMITPPVGLNLFILKAITNIPMGTIIKGTLPYVVVMIIGLVILCIFPQIALFIPNQM